MILVTGAGGTIGGEVVKQLRAARIPFRAAYFTENKVNAAKARGVDALTIDYHRPETLRSAFTGSDKLFLLGPPIPEQTQLELNAVHEAEAAGVKHVVKLSVWGADKEAFLLAKVHRSAERALEASGMAWTFLRPNSFMQNVVNHLGETIRAEDTFYSASGDAGISHIDARDIAAVAVKALTEPGHEGQAYALSGPEALTYSEMARTLSSVLERKVTHCNLEPSALEGSLAAAGLPAEYVAWLVDLERYYREGQASHVTGGVERVTGHKPIRFEQFAREHAALLQPLVPS